jgi:hypothetical protein
MKRTLAAFSLFLLTAGMAAAQAPSGQTISDRKGDQQQRIANGVGSGQLTAGETGNLEHREASINHEEHAMRRADDGHLTSADRAALTRRQNRVSRSIYRDKHNSRVR